MPVGPPYESAVRHFEWDLVTELTRANLTLLYYDPTDLADSKDCFIKRA